MEREYRNRGNFPLFPGRVRVIGYWRNWDKEKFKRPREGKRCAGEIEGFGKYFGFLILRLCRKPCLYYLPQSA